jgi:hypothetical protein
MWLGVRMAYREGVDDAKIKRFGFLGFVSQAGVVISITQIVQVRFGHAGEILATLLMSGVALNELFGPVLFKTGLTLAGEVGRATSGDPEEKAKSEALAPIPSVRATGAAAAAALAPGRESADEAALSKSGLSSWKADIGKRDLWGAPVSTLTPALDARMADLESELQALVRDVTRGPLQEFRSSAELYLRELRREFLRHHRRVAVEARSESARSALAASLRAEQAELAEKWRGIVCGRSAKLGRAGWSPERLIDAIDQIVDALPETMRAEYEASTFAPRDNDDMLLATRRALLRGKRGVLGFFRAKLAPREVQLRRLGRYHLSGKAPARLEGLAALFVQADQHLGARTRSIFDGIVSGYETLASRLEDPELDLEAAVIALRQQVEQELALALEEVRRITRDGTRRTATVLAKGLVQMKADVLIYDTLDLPPRARRSSRVFQRRLKAINRLTHELEALRRSNAATYSLLAMELELVGLEARVKEALGEHVSRLENEVKRRAVSQIERVNTALQEAIVTARAAIEGETRAGELAAALRAATENVSRTAEEASRVISGLQEELVDERKVAPILDALMQAASSLTDTYDVLGGRLQNGEWKLPAPIATVHVDFREHVSQHLESHVGPKLLAVTRDLAQKAGPIAIALHELERLVAFNVELATSELEVVADEAVPEDTQNLLRDMVTGQLERSQAQVQSYVDSCRHFPTDLGAGMRDSVLGALETMHSSFLDGEISQTSLGAMRRAARVGRFVNAFTRLPEVLRSTSAHLAQSARSLVGEEGISIWRRRLGLPVRPADLALDPRMFAAPSAKTELPMVYRRLFAPDTLEAIDVHTGREKDIEHAIRILAKEAGGKLRSVALVGIDGVGKAAVAAAIMRGRRWKSIRRVTFTEPQTVADVENLFREGSEGQIVVVEGLCWLMSTHPGGFEPLRRFVDGIIRDGARRAFLVHVDELVWKFATSVAAVGEAFPTVIHLEPLTVEELKSAVIARHDMSGFSHGFDPSVSGSSIDRLVARIGNRFRRPYDRYFEELHEATGGLVRDALRMWLASIRQVEYGEVVILGRVPSSAHGALRRLPESIALQLFQVARQGWTDARTQSHLFRIDEATARAQLAHLAHLGLLTEARGVHRIAPHLRGALTRLFEEKGWA